MKKASQLNNQQQVTCFAVLVVQNRFAPSAPSQNQNSETVLARGCSSQNRFYVNLNLWFGSVRFGSVLSQFLNQNHSSGKNGLKSVDLMLNFHFELT